ncbi:restriction endonuclease subunit S [Micromonospora sp. WMMD754]|uniref:restriction endonuclease subunit S n=1 Tax=Micromonospora sp. WMMD754 TaxID=3404114 RepID=UPI003BF4EA8E
MFGRQKGTDVSGGNHFRQVKSIPLAELATVTAGPSGSLLENLHDGPEGVPVLAPANFTENHDVNGRGLRRIPKADMKKLARFTLKDSDLVVVRQGAIGRLAVIGVEQSGWLYSSSCLRVRTRGRIVSPRYLAYYLSHPAVRKDLMDRALPGTVTSINTSVLNELMVAVPSLLQQDQIVEALRSVDDEIATHQAMAERLRSLKPAILDKLTGRSE